MINFYSDPHLGLTLGANTTVSSRKRLQLRLEDQLAAITAPRAGLKICAGDFFHKHTNPEDVILRAARLARLTNFILGGNHDVTNISDRKGSLDVLEALGDRGRILPVVFGQDVVYTVKCIEEESTVITLVPHHTTQALFEEALNKAEAELQHVESDITNILVLHCNYDCQFASDETSLNLRAERAKTLLDVFDYVLLGHEHNPKEDFDNRLIVIGNTHPTGFSDISDKRVITFDKGYASEEIVWSKNKHYLEIGPGELERVNADTQFLRIVGELDPSELHPYTRALRKMWSEHPDLFAVRSEVVIKGGDKMAAFGRAQTLDIKQLITEELRGNPELFELWEEISA